MSKESKIILAILAVVVVGVVGLVTFVNNASKQNLAEAMETLQREDSHTAGTGSVQVVEFGDYQCPSCAQAHPITERLIKEYGDRITFVFRNFPLPMHRNALPAAKAAEAAAEQGKFWEMNAKLFEEQTTWGALADPESLFIEYASQLELDINQFKQDMESEAVQARISQDQSDGYNVNIQATPTFFVGGEQQRRFDYDTLKGAIEAKLN